MEDKGQASAEYLLIVVVILVIMATITIPLVGSSINSTMATSMTSDSANAVQSIANAVNIVYANGPGAKRTINVYIPQETDLNNSADNVTINGSFIGMQLTNLTRGPYNSSHIQTQKEYKDPITNETISSDVFVYANTNYPVNIVYINVPTPLDKNWYKVTVYWTVGEDSIHVDLTKP